MKRPEAIALIMYLQRALPIIPTTGSEWTALSVALPVIEGIANGTLEIEVKQTRPAEAAEVQA